MTGVVGANPIFTFRSALAGGPLANGTVDVFVAGTTTRTNTWQDEALTSLNANPIVLDSAGRATIWFDPSITYKFVVKNAGGATQYTSDNIKGSEPSNLRALLAASSGSSLVGFIQAGAGAVAQTEQDVLRGVRISVFSFMTAAQRADVQSGAPVMDHTASIAAALAQAETMAAYGGFSSSGGVYVHLPAGQYRATKVTRRSGVAIVGDGSRNTVVMAIAVADPGIPFGFFELEAGPVVASHLRGLTICGSSTPTGTAAVNANQWGLYSRAQWDAGFTQGGLWHSVHEDVQVRAFNKGEWSRAGYSSAHSKLPNQFNTYVNFVAQVCTGGEARRFTGQHGQIAVINGDSGGLDGLVASRAYTFDWDPDPSTMAVNASGLESTADVAGTGNAVRCPELVHLMGGTGIQRANTGAYVRNTRGVHILGAWLEGLGYSFELVTNGGVYVRHSRFANAGDGTRLAVSSAGNGAIVVPGTNANWDIDASNFLTGTYDNLILGTADLNNTFREKFGFHAKTTDGKTNITTPPTLTLDTSGSVDVKGHDFVYLRADPGDLTRKVTTISSHLVPGDILTIRGWTGPITLGNTGNIRFGANAGTLTVADGNYITLRRVFGFSSVEWIVLSVEDYRSDTTPASGYWSRGTRIWKLSASPGGSPGWIVTTAGIVGSGAVFTAMPIL